MNPKVTTCSKKHRKMSNKENSTTSTMTRETTPDMVKRTSVPDRGEELELTRNKDHTGTTKETMSEQS